MSAHEMSEWRTIVVYERRRMFPPHSALVECPGPPVYVTVECQRRHCVVCYGNEEFRTTVNGIPFPGLEKLAEDCYLGRPVDLSVLDQVRLETP